MGPVQPAAIPRHPRWRRRRFRRARVPLHRRLRQDPAAVRHWLLVVVLATLLASLVGRALDRADHARSQWGRTATVWVADRPLRAGDDLAGALRTEPWPIALAPPTAIHRAPVTGRAAADVDAGAVVTAAMVDAGRREHRTVAVPLPDAHLPVRTGDRVDVWATVDPATTADGAAVTRQVAADARVDAVAERTVVLRVTPGQVEAVAEASATATIALVGEP